MLHVYLTNTYIHKDNNGVVSVVSFCVFFLFFGVFSLSRSAAREVCSSRSVTACFGEKCVYVCESESASPVMEGASRGERGDSRM